MAGETATHTVCLAKVVTEGKERGLHWFIVPLRDPKTGQLMPGVTAGFMGPKAGRNGLDNGYIQFSNVRVPRQNMLQRWATVSAKVCKSCFFACAANNIIKICYIIRVLILHKQIMQQHTKL